MNTLLRDTKFGFTKFSQCCAKGSGGGTCTSTVVNFTHAEWEDLVSKDPCPSPVPGYPKSVIFEIRSAINCITVPLFGYVCGAYNTDCKGRIEADIVECTVEDPDLMDPVFWNVDLPPVDEGECSCGDSCNCTCDSGNKTDFQILENTKTTYEVTVNAKIKFKKKLVYEGIASSSCAPVDSDVLSACDFPSSPGQSMCQDRINAHNSWFGWVIFTVNVPVKASIRFNRYRTQTTTVSSTSCG